MYSCLFFRSHDHIYKLIFKPKEKKVILWKSLEDILAQALTTCLVNIQHYSKDDKNALLYFCLNQSSLSGGLRSNVQALNDNSISSMVSEFMSTFHRFLSSNAEMPLDNSFEVYFHVASSKYLNRPTHRRKAVPLRSLVGASNETTKCLLPGGLIDLPVGAPDDPECFKNSCLLAALAYLHLELQNPEKFAQVKLLVLQKSTAPQRNKASQLLVEEMNLICSGQTISFKGPHDIFSTIRSFYEMYKIQVIVIMSLRGPKPELISWPEEIDQTIPRFYLFANSNSSVNDHVQIIQNLSTFFSHNNRAICFYCKSFYFMGYGVANKNKHKCRSTHSCQSCFSFYSSATLCKSDKEPWAYCDSQMVQTDANIVCSKCGFKFKSQICYDNHCDKFCNVGQYYWSCPCCSRSVAMRGRSIKEIEESHNCYSVEKWCLTCHTLMPKDHICPISKASETIIWPNLAVLEMIFQDVTGALCQSCFELQSNYMKRHNLTYKQMLESKESCNLMCNNHRVKKCSVPNVIKFCFERDRFEFESQTFSEKNFLLSDLPLSETLNLSYCSNPLPCSSRSSRKRKVNSGNRGHRKIANPQTAADQFLNFVIDQNLRNYTVLVQSNQEMLYLLEILLENFWHPTVVQSGRVIKKLGVSDLDLTFILFSNYCKGNLNDMLTQFEIKRSVFYFPMAYNDPKYYGKIVTKPEFHDFQSFFDTPEELQAKLSFYKTVPSTINVNHFLYQSVSENLKSFLLCVAKFVELCFELQATFTIITNRPNTKLIHPMDPKICSISSFAMAICKYFYLNDYNIKSVLHAYTGWPAKCSSLEYEFLVYMSYSKSEEKIEHAFNCTTGQKRFRHVLVDGYSSISRTVYQFYGCQVIQLGQNSRERLFAALQTVMSWDRIRTWTFFML